MPGQDRIPLADAAIRLGLTYHKIHAMVLRGQLKGGRDDFGRFFVQRSDLEALEKRLGKTKKSRGR